MHFMWRGGLMQQHLTLDYNLMSYLLARTRSLMVLGLNPLNRTGPSDDEQGGWRSCRHRRRAGKINGWRSFGLERSPHLYYWYKKDHKSSLIGFDHIIMCKDQRYNTRSRSPNLIHTVGLGHHPNSCCMARVTLGTRVGDATKPVPSILPSEDRLQSDSQHGITVCQASCSSLSTSWLLQQIFRHWLFVW